MAKRKGKAQGVVVKAGGSAAAAKAASQQPQHEAQQQPESGAKQAVGRKKRRKVAKAATSDPVPAEDEDSEEDHDVKGASSAIPQVALGTAAPQPPSPWLDLPNQAEEAALAWLVWPMDPKVFLAEYWEKKPLHLKRSAPNYYDGLFSKQVLDTHLRTSEARYGERVNLARFDTDKAEKIDANPSPHGSVVKAAAVDKAFASGATIQAMHPQQFHTPVRNTLSALERSFGATCGANAYLTPRASQGFAPSFDDVEVFMLQLEGAKRWRLHEPPAGHEHPLPRECSRDFRPEELGDQLLDCVLSQGNLLYLPRGTVHSGITDASASFSHHLTVSTYQNTSWFSLMEKALSGALERAARESSEFREGLPLNYFKSMGSWHELGTPEEAGKKSASGRAAFLRRFSGLLSRLQEFVDLDGTCDEFSVDFMAQRLPPRAAASASSSSSAGAGQRAAPAEGTVQLDSKVRWVDPSAVRPMVSTDPETSEATVLLFHSCANDCNRHMCVDTEADEDVGCLRFEASTFLPALRALHGAGAEVVRVGDLPLAEETDRVALCENLIEAGCVELVA